MRKRLVGELKFLSKRYKFDEVTLYSLRITMRLRSTSNQVIIHEQSKALLPWLPGFIPPTAEIKLQ
jgi:hypothetical protein